MIEALTSKGFLYVAFGKRYIQEARVSARSLRRFTKHRICIVTDGEVSTGEYFDLVIQCKAPFDFVSKIIGMRETPFEKTVFLDTDTFVCSSIDNLFDALEIFDIAATTEHFMHSYAFLEKYNKGFPIQYERLVPEYNTGVLVFRSNETVRLFFEDWLSLHEQMHVKADMPSFREAFIKNVSRIKILTLPFEYNYFGTKSFGFAYNEIKVIHERLGERWDSLTSVMLPFEKMDKKAKMMNKYKGKRIIVPFFGVISYRYNPYHFRLKLKQLLGIKRTKKSETF